MVHVHKNSPIFYIATLTNNQQVVKVMSAIFQPFRAVGVVSGDVPFSLNTLGSQKFVTVPVGNSFHVYNCADLRLALVSSLVDRPITACCNVNEVTFIQRETYLNDILPNLHVLNEYGFDKGKYTKADKFLRSFFKNAVGKISLRDLQI